MHYVHIAEYVLNMGNLVCCPPPSPTSLFCLCTVSQLNFLVVTLGLTLVVICEEKNH